MSAESFDSQGSTLNTMSGADSDASGHYLLVPNVPAPGSYCLGISVNGLALTMDGSGRWTLAKPKTCVKTGTVARVVNIVWPKTVSVSGRIIAKNGKAAAIVGVDAEPILPVGQGGFWAINDTKTNASGKFTVQLVPGTWAIGMMDPKGEQTLWRITVRSAAITGLVGRLSFNP